MKLVSISFCMGLALSACLYFGQGAAHQFAFYVIAAFNVAAWFALVCGAFKTEAKERVRSCVWVQSVGTGLQLYALVATGHPALAASSLLVSILIVANAFSDKSKESAA